MLCWTWQTWAVCFLGIQQGPIDFGMSRPHLVIHIGSSKPYPDGTLK